MEAHTSVLAKGAEHPNSHSHSHSHSHTLARARVAWAMRRNVTWRTPHRRMDGLELHRRTPHGRT
ncbi:hypothetical protein HanPSC8_Chr01g0014131 [Helianthus annuus]|nr:hypothetical protein HanPSC8_Chr01g0014131 [Helianthus annuus]